MAIITWNKAYSVGVEELDKQHQVLITIINKLFSLYTERKFGQTDVEPIFKELMDYTDQHFSTEEHYFQLYNFPQKEQHTSLHNAYRERITNLRKEYEEKTNEQTLFAVNNFLNDWWIWHINNADKKYTEYFNANGLK